MPYKDKTKQSEYQKRYRERRRKEQAENRVFEAEKKPETPNGFESSKFKPGQSGNVAGRPPGSRDSVRARLRRRLASVPPAKRLREIKAAGIDMGDKTYSDLIAATLLATALDGDMAAIREVFAQTEKPLTQTIGLEGAVDLNLTSDIIETAKAKLKKLLMSRTVPLGLVNNKPESAALITHEATPPASAPVNGDIQRDTSPVKKPDPLLTELEDLEREFNDENQSA